MPRKLTAANQEGNAVKQGWGCYDLNVLESVRLLLAILFKIG